MVAGRGDIGSIGAHHVLLHPQLRDVMAAPKQLRQPHSNSGSPTATDEQPHSSWALRPPAARTHVEQAQEQPLQVAAQVALSQSMIKKVKHRVMSQSVINKVKHRVRAQGEGGGRLLGGAHTAVSSQVHAAPAPAVHNSSSAGRRREGAPPPPEPARFSTMSTNWCPP